MRLPPSEQLAQWLGRQRWFAGRASAIASLEVTAVGPEYAQDGLAVQLTVVSVTDQSPSTDQYLLPLAAVRGRAVAADPIHRGDVEYFDALTHPAAAVMALTLLGQDAGPVRTTWLDAEPMDLRAAALCPGEQSNSSVLTRSHVLKVLRRLQAGPSPEVEIGQALRGSAHVATLCGWSSIGTGEERADALVVHRRVDGMDGFRLAVEDAGRAAAGVPERHFPGVAYELGIAVGAVHDELGRVFGELTSGSFAAELSARLLRRLDALSGLRVLDPYRATAAAVFGELARGSTALVVQRVHGDLHLGQALFGEAGWRLIDFEGEPRRSLAERRLPDSPMRDLAGMLRSFDYAARWNGAGAESAPWEQRTRSMFLEGYRLQRPDGVDRRVLDALTLDKALYEVGYEAAYRPERVRIPLAAVAALCGPEPGQ